MEQNENIEKPVEPVKKSDSKNNDIRNRIIVKDVNGREHEVNGEILSVPGARLHQFVKGTSHELFALTSEGKIFVAGDHIRSMNYLSFVAAVKAAKESIFEPAIVVDMASIKIINEATKNRSHSNVSSADETEMAREIHKVIDDAASRGASDIHIIDKADGSIINMRLNGSIQKVRDLQSSAARSLMAAIFANSEESDASYQEMEPQGARISKNSKTISLPNGVQALRLQWIPLANGGRKLVMRFLYSKVRSSEAEKKGINSLGYNKHQLDELRLMRSKTTGVTIMSGPTGSGKSTTLKVMLEELMSETFYEKNALTVEDPPEYPIFGVDQIPVNNVRTREERSRKFQEAINAALRSDPDVIMIGEIRNTESAKLAFEAAMSGHQVFTTLHANSALGSIDRLKDIGVEAYKLYDPSVIVGLIGQRLVPRLCPHCKISFGQAVRAKEVERDLLARVSKLITLAGVTGNHIYVRGPGCKKCDRGHFEQVIATETIVPDDTLMDLLRAEKKVEAKAYWLEKLGGYTMLAHAITKMLKGEVSPLGVESRVEVLIYDEHMKDLLQEADNEADLLAQKNKKKA